MTTEPRTDGAATEPPKWEPLTPQRVAQLMRGVDVPWWIAGGWALDLFAGRQTRAHTDIEISVFRGDEATVRRHLDRWECSAADAGTLTPLRDDQALPVAAHVRDLGRFTNDGIPCIAGSRASSSRQEKGPVFRPGLSDFCC